MSGFPNSTIRNEESYHIHRDQSLPIISRHAHVVDFPPAYKEDLGEMCWHSMPLVKKDFCRRKMLRTFEKVFGYPPPIYFRKTVVYKAPPMGDTPEEFRIRKPETKQQKQRTAAQDEKSELRQKRAEVSEWIAKRKDYNDRFEKACDAAHFLKHKKHPTPLEKSFLRKCRIDEQGASLSDDEVDAPEVRFAIYYCQSCLKATHHLSASKTDEKSNFSEKTERVRRHRRHLWFEKQNKCSLQ